MEVSTEISQKIRSAIKAKLMELGAYVDDELPDYIMVMVANKKSRLQMSNDLGLFLGTNTEAFTGWLHGLLGKLQTITVESGDKSKPKVSKERKKDKKEGKEKRKSKKHTSESSTSKKKPDLLDKSETGGIESKQTVLNENALEGANDTTLKSKLPKELGTINIDRGEMDSVKTVSIQEDVEDVRQLLVTGTQADELAEELETTEEEVKKSLTVGSKISKAEGSSVAREKDISTTHHVTGKSRSPTPDKNLSSATNRKRKMPISVVASVTKKSDNEEEYDPHNPAVGSVASVVRVTSRRSSVPASLQANRATDSDSSKVGADTGEPPLKMLKVSGAANLGDIKQVLEEVILKYQENSDDVTLFAKMVESSLRRLKAEQIALAKLQIHRVLCRFEASESVNGSLDKLNTLASGQDVSCHDTSVGNGVDTMDKAKNSLVVISTSGSDPTLRPGQSITSTKSSGNCLLKNEPTVSSLDSLKGGSKSSMVNDLLLKSHGKQAVHARSKARTHAHSAERQLTEEPVPQSPVSSSKIDSGSPSSVQSCPPSSTSGSDSLAAKRCIVSTSTSPSNSRNSKLAEFKPLAGTSGSNDKSIPSIIVDSIHKRSKSDSSEPVSVLRQCGNRTKGMLGAPTSDCEEESTRINPEALKVMAKNLKVTVINKRAAQNLDQFSSEDTSSDESDDEDSSDDEDDAKNSIGKKGNKKLENDETLDLSQAENKNA